MSNDRCAKLALAITYALGLVAVFFDVIIWRP